MNLRTVYRYLDAAGVVLTPADDWRRQPRAAGGDG